MEFNGREIWKYEKNNAIHIVRVFERKDNVLVIENEGTACLEGCEKMFDFILEYKKRKTIPVLILLDNTKLQIIDSSVKMLLLRFQEANHTIKKIAAFGNNVYIQQFAKIYQHTCNFEFRIKSFTNKNLALNWLKKTEER